ncbi:MAG: hypothetical protein ABR507_01575 [Actinomycetota bacterium]
MFKQLEIFGPKVDAFFVPDNHLGVPALSSVDIGVEIKRAGFKAIVGLTARDRNLLRFKSDLMTLQAHAIEEVLFLYGDDIVEGRSSLNVRKMLSESAGYHLRRGAVATIGKPLRWRERADFIFTQLEFVRARPGYWRESQSFSQPLYCGVIALPEESLARKVVGNIPGLNVPPGYFSAFAQDPEAGFKAAIEELDDLYRSGVDGAQLVVPAGRRRFAEMLTEWLHDRIQK